MRIRLEIKKRPDQLQEFVIIVYDLPERHDLFLVSNDLSLEDYSRVLKLKLVPQDIDMPTEASIFTDGFARTHIERKVVITVEKDGEVLATHEEKYDDWY